MKKIQRSFAVEYKSGRRKPIRNTNSIWGNLDLKSVAQDVQDETTPFPVLKLQDNKSGGELTLPETDPAGSLTRPIGQQTNTSVPRETIMADEFSTTTNSEAPAVVEAPIAAKKQRKPRAKKVAAETVAVEAAAEPVAVSTSAPVKQKRGRKAKAIGTAASSAKPAPVKRAPKTAPAATAAPTAAIDEIADLLQLEEENQRLRKLLSEKLRAENADLRKRLKLD
ncbi:hypothetical protein QO002_005244 [Pararhizobium capsulatum DSM 1112]|uniref:Transcriptional regulator n=1 Tax=Pararhizobium capsulatum DSM 1112 TaxID=1121113 RepID=A0ABU0BXP6_9HYPH|nr:transcriptional regulator [Pararhizobium capsulatum]MDQ0323038.1 hypothetical protein [Pararhizobium capsulatum DSM 1112]